MASFNEALRGFLKYRSPRAYVITAAKIIFTGSGGIKLNTCFEEVLMSSKSYCNAVFQDKGLNTASVDFETE